MSHLTKNVAIIGLSHSASEPPIAVFANFNKRFWNFIYRLKLYYSCSRTCIYRNIKNLSHTYYIWSIYIHFLRNSTSPRVFRTPPLKVTHYFTYSLVRDVLSILCLPNTAFVSIYNCIISCPIQIHCIWTLVYSKDTEILVILTNIHPKASLDQLFLSFLSSSYRQALSTDRMKILLIL